VQFRSHYKFGSNQSPVEFSFNQGVIQPGLSSDVTQHWNNTDGRADKDSPPKLAESNSQPQAAGYNYPPPNHINHHQTITRSTPYWQVWHPTKTDAKSTTEEPEQSETDGKPTRSGTATRSETQYQKVYLNADGAYDCKPCQRTTSKDSRDSSSEGDHKPSLRCQNAIRRHCSPTPARPKSQSDMLSKQQERLIALASGETRLEPLLRPNSAGDTMYRPAQSLAQMPRPEYIDTPNIPRIVLQVLQVQRKGFREICLQTLKE
jgi:hypothetical protein